MHIGEQFRKLQEIRGVRGVHIARVFGVRQSEVSRWKRLANWPTTRVIKVAKLLGVEPSAFFELDLSRYEVTLPEEAPLCPAHGAEDAAGESYPCELSKK
jgi:transcriptional regulator with XRE-family HTH domain